MSEGDFELHKIKDLILKHMSGPSPTCEERQISNTDEWGLLKTTAVTWSGWNWAAHKVPPKEFWGNTRLEVQSGDVLVTKAGPRHRVGVVVYVDKTPPQLMVSGKMIGLRPDPDKVNYQVLAEALSQFEPQRYLDSRTTGMADSQLNFTNDLLLNTEIRLPPKPEQSKIAEILSTVDRAIEQTESLIAKQQRIKTGLMQDLLTRGIDEHGNLRSEEAYEVKDSSLGWIPIEWEVRRLDSVAEVKYGISDAIDEMNRSGIPTITLPCVKPNGDLDLSPENLAFTSKDVVKDRDFLKKGDLLFNWRNGSPHHLGKTAFFDGDEGFTHVGFLLRIRTDPEFADSRFLWFLINDIKAKGHFLNAKIQVNNTFNSSELKAVELAFPGIDEQCLIRDRLDAIEKSKDKTTVRLNKLRSVKTALMQDLLNGKVRVAPLIEKTETSA